MESSQNSDEISAPDDNQLTEIDNPDVDEASNIEVDQFNDDFGSIEFIEPAVPQIEIQDIPGGHITTTTEPGKDSKLLKVP